jgi:hypothetical protein
MLIGQRRYRFSLSTVAFVLSLCIFTYFSARRYQSRWEQETSLPRSSANEESIRLPKPKPKVEATHSGEYIYLCDENGITDKVFTMPDDGVAGAHWISPFSGITQSL